MKDLTDIVNTLKKAQKLSRMYGGKIYGQFSGRASILLYDLAKNSHIEVEWHYFPLGEREEVQKFIEVNYPDVIIEERRFDLKIHKEAPTENSRWCCQEYSTFKAGAVNLTGCRKGKTENSHPLKKFTDMYKHINEDRFSITKEQTVTCRNSKDTILISPLLAWDDVEIEQYLKEHSLPFLPATRCEGCPMAGAK